MLKHSKVNIFSIACIFTFPILNIIYTYLNSDNRVVYNLVTSFDNKIPFIKVFIIPYSLWYPFIIFSLFNLCIINKKIFYRTIMSIDLGLICCYITYILFQTTVPRPYLYGNDLFTKLVGLTYYLDKPYNCFPSIHILTSYLIIKTFYVSNIDKIVLKYLVFTMSGTIILSTLFVKQHVILDLFSGILLGEMTYYLSGFIYDAKFAAWIK